MIRKKENFPKAATAMLVWRLRSFLVVLTILLTPVVSASASASALCAAWTCCLRSWRALFTVPDIASGTGVEFSGAADGETDLIGDSRRFLLRSDTETAPGLLPAAEEVTVAGA